MIRMEVLLSYMNEGRALGPVTLVTRYEECANMNSVTPAAAPIDAGLQPFFFCECKEPDQPPDKALNGPHYSEKGIRLITIRLIFII